MTCALPRAGAGGQTPCMPRFCLLIDSLGLTFDDLWSYYEVLGRPAWAVLTPVLLASTALAAFVLA